MAQPSLQRRFHDWLSAHPDDQVLRWIFRVTLLATLSVLITDFVTSADVQDKADAVTSQPGNDAPPAPGLIPSLLAPLLPDSDRRVMPMMKPDGALAKPMTFDLEGGGRLVATGTIMPGISETFANEVKKRGDYIKTVVLNSPGGSVADAMAMGRLIRERKFATEVEDGKICASSCPLMFVGGMERKAAPKASIGVHQVFSVGGRDETMERDDMGQAQRISARCERYLAEMGIKLEMWLHAMETPKEKLFVFKPEELKSLNIVTAANEPQAASAGSPPKR